MTDSRFTKFFKNPKEELICTLGDIYAQEYLTCGSASKGFSVMSDKRLYFRGKTFSVKDKRFRRTKKAKTIELNDITNTSTHDFSMKRWVFVLSCVPTLIALIFFSAALYVFIKAFNSWWGVGFEEILFILISTILLSLLVFYHIKYRLSRKTLLKVEYIGGCVGLNVKWLSVQEIEEFQRLLLIAKENYIEEEEIIEKEQKIIMTNTEIPQVNPIQGASCTICGANLIDGVCPTCTEKFTQEAAPDSRFRNFFMNPNERLVCVLGNTYLQNFLTSKEITKGFSVVSDKRVYFRGTTYWVQGKKIRKMQESKTVDLKDVTGTSVTYLENTWMKILGKILLVIYGIALLQLIGFIFFNAFAVPVEDLDINPATGIVALAVPLFPLFIIGVVLMIRYNMSKINILQIEYAGGCIGFDINWFPTSESTEYQKQLRLAKDKAIEEAESATANAVTAAVSQIAAIQPAAVAAAPASSNADELVKYAELFEKGLITREEFDEYKAALKK